MSLLKFYKLYIFAPTIFRASKKGNIDKIRALILKGANVNIRLSDGLDPLMIASLKGHEDVVEELITSGARSKHI